MMHYKQKGLTTLGLLLVMFLIGSAIYAALRIVPLYIHYYKTVSVLESIKDDGVDDLGRSGIRTLIDRRFNISYVDHIDSSDVKIKMTRDGAEMTIDYEERAPLVYNLSVIASFKKTVEVAR